MTFQEFKESFRTTDISPFEFVETSYGFELRSDLIDYLVGPVGTVSWRAPAAAPPHTAIRRVHTKQFTGETENARPFELGDDAAGFGFRYGFLQFILQLCELYQIQDISPYMLGLMSCTVNIPPCLLQVGVQPRIPGQGNPGLAFELYATLFYERQILANSRRDIRNLSDVPTAGFECLRDCKALFLGEISRVFTPLESLPVEESLSVRQLV